MPNVHKNYNKEVLSEVSEQRKQVKNDKKKDGQSILNTFEKTKVEELSNDWKIHGRKKEKKP